MAEAKPFEVGGVRFSALRRQHPIPHWVLRVEESGEVFEAGAGGISTESVPKMKASIEELLERVSKNDVADFRRRLGLPNDGVMEIRMKSIDAEPGWLLRLMELGCQATYNHGPFGRTNWLVKKDGEAIKVVQGKHTVQTTRVDQPTDKQREIAAALASVGIATVS